MIRRRVIAAAVVVATVSACASEFQDTSAEVAENGTLAGTAVAVDEPVPEGAGNVLEAMAATAEGLSAQIGDDGDEDATFARIEELWSTIEPDLFVDDPALANGVQAAVEMARTAVVRNRPGDANKAASLLSNLAAGYSR